MKIEDFIKDTQAFLINLLSQDNVVINFMETQKTLNTTTFNLSITCIDNEEEGAKKGE